MLIRYLALFVKYTGVTPLLSLMLLGVAVSSLVLTLADLLRGLNLAAMLPATFLAILLGWALASRQHVPGWLAAGLLAVIGLELVVVQVSRLETTLLALGSGIARFLWQLWLWPATAAPPPLAPVLEPLSALSAGLTTLSSRVAAWLPLFITGQPTFDPVAAVLVWSLALWSIAAWAGWALPRTHQPLIALLPLGVLQATLLAYHPGKAGNLLPLVVVTLLLLGLFSYLSLAQRWQAHGIDVTPTLPAELVLAVVPIAALLAGLAGVMPSISIWEIASRIQTIFEPERIDPMAGSLGLEKGASADEPRLINPIPAGLRSPGLPRQHLLGSGPELSERVALIISTGQPSLPSEAAKDAPPPPRYYWRGLTYDRYTGQGWATGRTRLQSYAAGEPAITAPENAALLHQTVQAVTNQGGLLYTAGALITVNFPFSVNWRDTADFFGATTGPANYRASSVRPGQANADALRAAGSDYPAAIRRRYLALPDTVPERVLALGRELTAAAPTPYDRAAAIESYLRQFPYSLDLPEPPSGSDLVDYFLFELQTGYCDYYASAMVVLARAAGLPARLAVGYSSGSFDPVKAHYVVTEANAHSWAEVYFPGYGWVEFEPTAAQPVTDRTDALPEANLPAPEVAPPATSALPGAMWLWLLPLTAALLALVGGGWWLADSWQLRRASPGDAAALLFERLHRHSLALGATPAPGVTPYEFAAALAAAVTRLAGPHRRKSIAEPAAGEIDWLAQLYVQTAYSSHPPTVGQQAAAITTWRRLRRRLWRLRLLQFSRRFL